MSGEGKVVCVTGASGYIASWLVKLLLQRGYTVKATVRSLKVVDPAVKGTLNVLKSSARVPSIKRVVLTSSMAAVMVTGRHLKPGVVMDETWFSDPLLCEQSKSWYALSKTLAEDAALKFSKENGIDLLSINPGYVIGPLLQPTLNLTSEGILNFIKSGKEVFSDGVYRYVDVRDVANAHILAFEGPSASGRYCVVGTVTYSAEVVKILHKLYPALNLSEKCKDDKPFVPPYEVSKERAKGLGLDFTPLEVSIKDTVESLKEKKFLSF